ncbi:50S ribosomal protein L21 [bacterium NHP-B]|nr:50S ribosomal protein L21 [Candidatus Hepatobacter penaei]TGW14820.1 50S ribosomal protein L21 [bacterium NHP-B]
MFAVVVTGGKQYRVSPGDVVSVEKLEADGAVVFDHVLMVNDGKNTHIGAPKVDGAEVKADVMENIRTDKVLVFKKKRRNNYRRLNGHRQSMTLVRVRDILLKGQSVNRSGNA